MASLAVALWDSGVAEWSLTCCIGLFNHWLLIISTLFTFFFESSYVFFFHYWSQQPIPTLCLSHSFKLHTLSLTQFQVAHSPFSLLPSYCPCTIPPTSSLTCTHCLLPTISPTHHLTHLPSPSCHLLCAWVT